MVDRVPEDEAHLFPPQEKAIDYTRCRSSGCCCCICYLIGIFFSLYLLLILATIVVYLIIQPGPHIFAIDNVSIKGMNITSLSSISPEFDVSIKANNGNNNIGLNYVKYSTIKMFYKDILLGNGFLPLFYQPTNNVTVFHTMLKGTDIELVESYQNALLDDVAKRNVPLKLKLKVGLRFKVVLSMWENIYTFECNVGVDELTEQAKIVHNNNCDMISYRISRGVNLRGLINLGFNSDIKGV